MKRINEKNVSFLMIDIQEKFLGKIPQLDMVIKNSDILNKASELLEIPLFITEQYPKGLGKTIENIYIPENAKIFEKTLFSALDDTVNNAIKETGNKWLVLYGIEAHVCLTQTALDALDNGYNVMYVVDAVSSRNLENKEIALRRLQSAGVVLVSTEMLLFELVKDAKHPKFKEISRLIK